MIFSIIQYFCTESFDSKNLNITDMIRLNVFFEVKEEVDMEQLNALCQELVEKSLADEGNIAYDYFVSGTRDGVMMICETWQNAKVLKTHMESAHFTTLVPQIEALTKHGLKLEQFQFEK